MDLVGFLVGITQLFVFILTGVTFLRWIYRANLNARARGAQGMKFTPGWSVGWYFIPIANLWKPYQAMKEIWQASRNRVAWTTGPVPSLIGTWRGLWLITNFLEQMSFRLALRSTTETAATASTVLSLASDLLEIPMCLVAIRLVNSIYKRQCDRMNGVNGER